MSQQAERSGWRACRITQAKPLQSVETQVRFASALRHLQGGGRVHVWFSLPCTAWSSWQRINKAKAEDLSAIKGKENESLFLQQLFRSYGFQVMKEGREVSFERPAFCDGWKCDIVREFVDLESTYSAMCHGCMFGLVTKATGIPMKKPFQIISLVKRLTEHLEKFVCDKSHPHAATQGADTMRTGNYLAHFCREVMKALEETACAMNLEGTTSLENLFTGNDKGGYTVDAAETTGWMDLI
eukprot:415181-Amphidinium_carterae.2